ncbi:MAG: glycoside hydrolase family 13 protein [Gaiellaceae bacterium]
MLVAAPSLATLFAEPHHDGSDLYVMERPDGPRGTAVVRVRVPRGTAVEGVALRRVKDGEARVLPATIDAETETDTWWRASFDVSGPLTRYRWLLTGGDFGYAWLNGMGLVPYDPPDSDDFVLSLDPGGPDWHLRSVVYEIYPDRFARGGVAAEPPEWAVPREWDELPTGRGRLSSREWFGGDLPGIEQHLDHVQSLGANVLYLTPFFPAGSTHRYDATSFDRVDPLLGGDEALASLIRAAHGRGLRILGDLTLNHTGVGHEWFTAGRSDLYYFDDGLPHGYEAWLGIPSLPKLNWASPELRRRMRAVVRRWLDAGLDGWRIDVANMVGRLGPVDLAAEAARLVRAELADDQVVVAEHFHDFRDDLDGTGWHGVMNYAGFLKPVWSWLRSDGAPDLELHVPLSRLDGLLAATTMRAFRAGVPWQGTLHSWVLLDSHDTARFRTVAGSRERQLVGVGLQMTTPGVPMVYAGDELGLEGRWGEDGRRPMPWSHSEDWDPGLLEGYRALIALRRASPALARGGIRYASVGADVLCYLRETEDERLLCLAARARHEPVRVPFRSLETLHGEDAEDGVLPADGPAFHVWRIHG